jgi:hypothetical protein
MKTTTKQVILSALSDGQPWTLSALTKLTKSTKVSTRISDLRREGYNITNKIEYRKGSFYSSTYQLVIASKQLAESPNGYYAVEQVGLPSCNGCDLKESELCYQSACTHNSRKDGKDVIFKQLTNNNQ